MNAHNGSRPEFKAGQVAVLEMNEFTKYMAFASSPEDGEFEFLIKRDEKPGLANAIFDPHIAKKVRLNDVVGRGFSIEDHKGCDLVFVAMGTGLAPLRSALRHIFHSRNEYGRLIVLYGVRTIEDFCYEEEMNSQWHEHGVELRQVISQPGDSVWDRPTGYVQSLLDNIVLSLTKPVALICGSKDMMEQTRSRLVEMGFEPGKILTNY